MYPLLQTMDGSSTINYMLYVRGNPRDYDEWAEEGNRGCSYEEVQPYFLKSENNRDPQVTNLIIIYVFNYDKIKMYKMNASYYYSNYSQNKFYSLYRLRICNYPSNCSLLEKCFKFNVFCFGVF